MTFGLTNVSQYFQTIDCHQVKHLSTLIEWPSGNDVKAVVEAFESMAGFPGVIGEFHNLEHSLHCSSSKPSSFHY